MIVQPVASGDELGMHALDVQRSASAQTVSSRLCEQVPSSLQTSLVQRIESSQDPTSSVRVHCPVAGLHTFAAQPVLGAHVTGVPAPQLPEEQISMPLQSF